MGHTRVFSLTFKNILAALGFTGGECGSAAPLTVGHGHNLPLDGGRPRPHGQLGIAHSGLLHRRSLGEPQRAWGMSRVEQLPAQRGLKQQ